MKNLLFALLLLFSCFRGNAQPADNAGYVADFEILLNSLKELHPQLYRVLPQAEFDKEAIKTKSKIAAAPSKAMAQYEVQRFLVKIGDVHTIERSMFRFGAEKKLLPFAVYIIKHRVFIKDLGATENFNGAELFSINGLKAATILDSIGHLVANDGNRDLVSFDTQILFNSFYARFVAQPDSFLIETDKGVLRCKAAVPGNLVYERIAQQGVNDFLPYSLPDPDMLVEVSSKAAYFNIVGFAKKYHGHNYKKAIARFDRELQEKKPPYAVIDLRYNTGGDPKLACKLAKSVADHPFRMFEYMEQTTVKHPANKQLMENKSYFIFRHWGDKRYDDHCEVVRYSPGLKTYKPHSKPYSGKVYVLAGPWSMSSSTMICAYLQGQKNVEVIGCETPGAVNCFWANNHCKLHLERLDADVNFPYNYLELKKNLTPNARPQGLVPDTVIDYSIDDLLKKHDPVMELIYHKQGE